MVKVEISIEKLMEYCVKYDKQYGDYPESMYEGKYVFIEIIGYLSEDKDITEQEKKFYLDAITSNKFYSKD